MPYRAYAEPYRTPFCLALVAAGCGDPARAVIRFGRRLLARHTLAMV